MRVLIIPPLVVVAYSNKIILRDFLEPPTSFVGTFSLHKVREIYIFLDHPPTPMSLRKGAFTYDVKCFGSFLTYLPMLIRYHQLWLDLPIHPPLDLMSDFEKFASQINFHEPPFIPYVKTYQMLSVAIS